MQNSPGAAANRRRDLAAEPKYLLGSVDSALQLLQLLRDEGSLRVMAAAEHLGVSRSTAHRLLGMLVYRGFAVQDEDRVYQPGPGMNVPPVRTNEVRIFKAHTEPLFRDFVADLGETVSLVTRFGTTSRFIETYVPVGSPAISSRRGQILPARHTSAGKALLSVLPDTTLARLYRSEAAALSGTRMTAADFRHFLEEMREVREQQYAVNREETEAGIWALSMPVRASSSASWLAFAVAVPRERSYSLHTAALLERCRSFRAELEQAALDA